MLIGKRIYGRYKIVGMIGGGGMANVYLAEDMILEREVAVKILRMDFSNDDEFIKRFNREAQSATSLAHQNIVSIYDVGEEDDIYFIVMEYVKGLTLKQYIQKNQYIPIDKAIHIMQQITSAISHAHQHGIIHRDIKPQNVLIDDYGVVKITDFGIATALSATSITQTNAVLGSVHYLSPEQARGGMANKKSDIYSLGIVMFELLTGRLPFSGESAVSIALKHLQSSTPSPRRWNPDIPQSVENIVLKATAKDPFHRYESVDEMQEDLTTALLPNRVGEKPFVIPEDMDATKAMPIITKDTVIPEYDDTIILHANTQEFNDNVDQKNEKSTKKKDKKKKKTKKSKNKEKKPKRRLLKILIATLVILALLAVFTVTVLPKLMQPSEIKVPKVEGKELNDAIAILMEEGLEIGETIEMEHEEIEKNMVIKTDPKDGRTVREGTVVDIYVSSGQKQIEVTDFTNRDIDVIKSLIDSLGYKDIDIVEEFNDDYEAGTVISQEPAVGTEVIPSETVIKLTVSKGANKIVLKNLVEFNERSLDDYAQEMGLKIVVKGEEYSDTIAKGLVISQYPDPFSKVDKGSTVQVTLSKGKKELPPQVVSRELTIPFDSTATDGQPQKIEIYIEDMNRSMTEPAQTIYITETIKKTIDFAIAPGKKAGYKIIRNNSVIMDDTIPYPNE